MFWIRLALASPALLASDLLDCPILFNLGAIVAGSPLRK